MTSNEKIVQPDEYFEAWELQFSPRAVAEGIYDTLSAKPIEECTNDMWLYPNLITDELCRKAPPALFLTTEFDVTKKPALEGAAVYRKNDRLIAIGIIGGTTHFSYSDYTLKYSDAWFNAIKTFTDKYL